MTTPQPNQLPEEVPMQINERERQVLVGALDSLGVSLAEKSHQWTSGEREIYEQACVILGVPSPATDNLCEGCGRPATTSDSEAIPLCEDCADDLKNDNPQDEDK